MEKNITNYGSNAKNIAEYTPEEIVKEADEKGKNFNRIKTNQIRNFFAEINRIRQDFKIKNNWDENIEIKLVLLKPKLAYAAGRKSEVKPFAEYLIKKIDEVQISKNKTKALENFIYLVESIVAYHKFYGGRDN